MSDRTWRNSLWALAAGVAGLLLVGPVFGGTVVFNIDHNQTSLTLTATVAGQDVGPQGTGSLTAKFDGSLHVTLDNDLTPTTLSIDSSAFDAEVNGQWQPLSGGSLGNADADFGGQAETAFGTLYLALRDFTVSGVTASTVPVTGTIFDAGAIRFTLTSATLDYNVGGFTSGTKALDQYTTNNITGSGTLSYAGSTATLSFPVDFYITTTVSGSPAVIHATGTAVATAQIGGGGLWSGASDVGGGWKWLEWFGYFNPSADPWIYHQEHSWLYAVGTDTTSIFFYDPVLKGGTWLWTSATTYPFLYRYSDSVWLWYQEGSTGPRWFYNFTAAAWESD